MKKAAIILLISAAFLVARFMMQTESVIHHEDIFKDMAHIWWGIVTGYAASFGWRQTWKHYPAYLAIVLGLGELTAFLYHKS